MSFIVTVVTANLMFLFGSGHVAWARDAIDGIKVDQRYLYVSGPGGLWVISLGRKHLGRIPAPKRPHRMAWGGEDYDSARCPVPDAVKDRGHLTSIRSGTV